MNVSCSRRGLLAAIFPPLAALTFAASGAATVGPDSARDTSAPIVRTDSGAVLGVAFTGGYAFRGLPYAAAPTGDLRWRAPRPPASWRGVRDATQYAASCPQPASGFAGPGPFSEDCLYLNVSTPTLRRHAAAAGAGVDPRRRLHPGRQPQLRRLEARGGRHRRRHDQLPAGRARLPRAPRARLAARWPGRQLRPDGPAGGAALGAGATSRRSAATRTTSRSPASRPAACRCSPTWSRPGSRGLFQRAIVQSGAFALNQVPLADAEAFGEAFAASVGLPGPDGDVPASRARRRRSSTRFPGAAIPGVVDGKVLTESIGAALAAGRFARVPILNGINHDEERLFVAGPPRGREWRHVRPGPAADPGDLRERRSPPCSACRPTGRPPSPPSTRSRLRLAGRRRSARWSPTRTSRARRCRSTAGRPGACRPSPTSSTTTPRPSASHRPAR